jgi:hypothetical protein
MAIGSSMGRRLGRTVIARIKRLNPDLVDGLTFWDLILVDL